MGRPGRFSKGRDNFFFFFFAESFVAVCGLSPVFVVYGEALAVASGLQLQELSNVKWFNLKVICGILIHSHGLNLCPWQLGRQVLSSLDLGEVPGRQIYIIIKYALP